MWKDRTKIKQYSKAYYLKNKEILIAKLRLWRKHSPEYQLLASAKKRAKKKGIEFSLIRDDIKIPTHCPYLGIALHVGTRINSDCSPSIDRIDNSKGYVRGNIEVISQKANTMKNNATKEELLKFAQALVLKFHNKFQDPVSDSTILV